MLIAGATEHPVKCGGQRGGALCPQAGQQVWQGAGAGDLGEHTPHSGGAARPDRGNSTGYCCCRFLTNNARLGHHN